MGNHPTPRPAMSPDPIQKLHKTEAEWRALLTPAQFRVLRGEGTEVCGTHPFNHEKRAGSFVCAGCFLPLFVSDSKFESGTGWPSFYEPLPGRLETKVDHHIGYPRTEYHCARCGGHQGHVFEDGPRPTGLRYCNNGEALLFVPAGEPLPELRN
ncbi:MAG: peptide-methionine (R)-S-oxide reductase [Nevskiaceae bacterium]|jgi:peptide-methionine (R)-S-oxide reductase|nr:MAG: peptide-methionine (R)-S-oxide reductase [Nevskiaceae bacterium]TAM28180.1 MAG: peptide-methionine (R)-S-oxide reductase [Nevskiaceae bacterium]